MTKRADHFVHRTITYLGVPHGVSHAAWTPNTDVYEKGDLLMVRLELAGVNRDELEITLDDRLLVVRGERRDPCRKERCTFRQMEIDYGHFERHIVIPYAVDGARAHAWYENGFLHLELPKSETTKHQTVTVIIECLE